MKRNSYSVLYHLRDNKCQNGSMHPHKLKRKILNRNMVSNLELIVPVDLLRIHSSNYKFDIFQDSPVDLFHVGLIGLLHTTIDLTNQSIGTARTEKIGERVNGNQGFGQTIQWRHKQYWNGDSWLKFLAMAQFVYDQELKRSDSFELSMLSSVMSMCVWLKRISIRKRMGASYSLLG